MKQSDLHKSTNYRENTSIFQFGAGDVEIVGNNWKSQQKKKRKNQKNTNKQANKNNLKLALFCEEKQGKRLFDSFLYVFPRSICDRKKKEREKKAAFPKELKKVKMWH